MVDESPFEALLTSEQRRENASRSDLMVVMRAGRERSELDAQELICVFSETLASPYQLQLSQLSQYRWLAMICYNMI